VVAATDVLPEVFPVTFHISPSQESFQSFAFQFTFINYDIFHLTHFLLHSGSTYSSSKTTLPLT